MAQCYKHWLQTVLEKKYNCKVEIINFSNESQRNMYAVLPKADNYKRLIKNVIWMTKYKEMKKQYKSYCEFSGKYFHLSSKEYSLSSQLEELVVYMMQLLPEVIRFGI